MKEPVSAGLVAGRLAKIEDCGGRDRPGRRPRAVSSHWLQNIRPLLALLLQGLFRPPMPVRYCPAMSPGKALFKGVGNAVPCRNRRSLPRADAPDVPLPDPGLREVLESIREPAILYLPGGRIAAVNRAADRLTTGSVVGLTLDELLDRLPARRPDGRPILRGDLPYARALRGEIVAQGERIEITLPDGSPHATLITSTPIVRDGRVVAALSVWHDFDEYTQRLARRRSSPEEDPASGT